MTYMNLGTSKEFKSYLHIVDACLKCEYGVRPYVREGERVSPRERARERRERKGYGFVCGPKIHTNQICLILLF